MPISDKKKKTLFHTCLHDLRKDEYGEILQEYLKENRDIILSIVSSCQESDNPNKWKEGIKNILQFINRVFIDNCVIPEKEEYDDQVDNVLDNIDNLIYDIKSGIINLDKIDNSQFLEWGGVGVIITSNENRSYQKGDIFVCTKLAHVITWLMFRLPNLSHVCINYTNKYEFYGTIAEKSKDFINERGNYKSNEIDLVLYLLDEISSLIKRWHGL